MTRVDMFAQQDPNVVADLMDVYRSANANADEAARRGRDTALPMIERLQYRHQAQQYRELADQALRMIHELTAQAAA